MYNLFKIGNTCNNKVFKEDYMKKNVHLKNIDDKMVSYVVMGAVIIAIIVVAILLYSQQVNDNVKEETMKLGEMTNIISENQQVEEEETESASTEIGKSVEESIEEVATSNENNTVESNNTNNVTQNNDTKVEKQEEKVENNTDEKEEQKELNFQKPVEGEIVKEFAQDNLIYSQTLEEWVTHNGIDIKAEKTTVVKSAEAGVVKSIKNDPRFGLTIVVEHDSVYQTVYSNLLTSEFVVEGETVEKGQALGTVGNSAVFEIADEPHLHFEILKNSIQVDPSIYIK